MSTIGFKNFSQEDLAGGALQLGPIVHARTACSHKISSFIFMRVFSLYYSRLRKVERNEKISKLHCFETQSEK